MPLKTPSLTRRDFLKITGLSLATCLVGTAGVLTVANEAYEPVIRRVAIPVPNLHSSLEGFRIVQMTDFHLYPYTTAGLVQEAVDLANSLKPDLAVLTGDYVWRIVDAAYDLADILSGLDARYGVYASLGNHDYWTDIAVVTDAFQQHRLPMLVNQGVPIQVGNAALVLAGLDDGWSGHPDLNAALENAPSGTPVVLLYHEPDLADVVSLDGRITLQLAGHTHGGQVRPPNRPPYFLPYLGKKYDLGLYRVNQMWLYTNPGIGMISVPYRYNCPPEVTEFTLQRG
jgi:predicted MPP superfamily phosphohydrolase